MARKTKTIDEKIIDGFTVTLKSETWYDDRGYSGIEKTIRVVARKEFELYRSEEIRTDRFNEDALKITEMFVTKDEMFVRLSDKQKVNFCVTLKR